MIGPRRSAAWCGPAGARLRETRKLRVASLSPDSPAADGRKLRDDKGWAAKASKAKAKAKAKEFAWMDSDEEDGRGSSKSVSPARASSRSTEQKTADYPPLPDTVSQVRSFPEMVRMAPSLQRRAPNMSAAELVAVCAAAARVKFYDGPLMKDVTSSLRRCMARRNGGGLRQVELVAVLSSLASLNAYDRELFSSAARVLARDGADGLEASQRLELLAAFKAGKHEGDVDFIEDLARRAKTERYEAAKEDLHKRNLAKMYGENQDLQGRSVDTERALLKRARSQVTRER